MLIFHSVCIMYYPKKNTVGTRFVRKRDFCRTSSQYGHIIYSWDTLYNMPIACIFARTDFAAANTFIIRIVIPCIGTGMRRRTLQWSVIIYSASAHFSWARCKYTRIFVLLCIMLIMTYNTAAAFVYGWLYIYIYIYPGQTSWFSATRTFLSIFDDGFAFFPCSPPHVPIRSVSIYIYIIYIAICTYVYSVYTQTNRIARVPSTVVIVVLTATATVEPEGHCGRRLSLVPI